VKDALSIFSSCLFRVLVISFVANVDELESYIAKNETTLRQAPEYMGMVTYEKQEAFMAAMKTYSQMEDQNNHHHEKEQALQKNCLFKLNKKIMKINKVYLQKIDTQKGVVDYFQSLIESGKSTYETVNKIL
jgi:hypothetical protein